MNPNSKYQDEYEIPVRCEKSYEDSIIRGDDNYDEEDWFDFFTVIGDIDVE